MPRLRLVFFYSFCGRIKSLTVGIHVWSVCLSVGRSVCLSACLSVSIFITSHFVSPRIGCDPFIGHLFITETDCVNGKLSSNVAEDTCRVVNLQNRTSDDFLALQNMTCEYVSVDPSPHQCSRVKNRGEGLHSVRP